MAYTLNLTNGAVFATLADGTLNNDSSLTIIGKNYAGYGEFIGENFLHILESGTNTTAPVNPLIGQLWFDSSEHILKVYSGSGFKNLGGATTTASPPAAPVTGDLWFDPNTSQLKVYDGSGWIVIGPSFTSATGVSGAFPEVILDTGSAPHIIIKDIVDGVVVGIVSKDNAFTPQTAIPGFTVINQGYTIVDGGMVSADNAKLGNLTIESSGSINTIIAPEDNTGNIVFEFSGNPILGMNGQGGTAEIVYYGQQLTNESIVTKQSMESFVAGAGDASILVDSNSATRVAATTSGVDMTGNIEVTGAATADFNTAELTAGIIRASGGMYANSGLHVIGNSDVNGNLTITGNLGGTGTLTMGGKSYLKETNIIGGGLVVQGGVSTATQSGAFVAYTNGSSRAYMGGYAQSSGNFIATTVVGDSIQFESNSKVMATMTNATFAVDGEITATGDITAFSDERLKENVETISDASSKIRVAL